jgi:exodeoxyribonuclease V alpha subunit
MKMESQQSDREVLAGLVERVTYQNADNGFCVIRLKARGHRDLVTVVGHAAVISAGEWITAAGDWTNDRTHAAAIADKTETGAPLCCSGCCPVVGSLQCPILKRAGVKRTRHADRQFVAFDPIRSRGRKYDAARQ